MIQNLTHAGYDVWNLKTNRLQTYQFGYDGETEKEAILL